MTNFPEILCERDAFRDLPVFKQFSVPQRRSSFHSSPSSHNPSDLKCLLFYVRPFPSASNLAARHKKYTYIVPSLRMYELQDLLLIFDLIALTSLRAEYKLGWCSLSNFLQPSVNSSLLGPSTLQSAILCSSL